MMKTRIKRANIEPGGRHVKSPESENYIDYGGWKIHISVDPRNYEAVDTWLDRNHPGQYKLLHGGERGESDFTIYVGNKDDMNILVRKMSREINHLLEAKSRGGLNSTDLKLTDRITARYDPQGLKNYYKGKSGFDGENSGVYYGRNGIPYDRYAADIRSQVIMGNHSKSPQNDESRSYWNNALIEHEKELKKDLAVKYGVKYTGTGGPHYPDELLRKKKIASKPKRKLIKKTCSCKKK